MFNRRNALIGYMVSKVVVPLAMRRMRRRVTGAGVAARGTSGSGRKGAARTSVALGAVLGAAGYVLSRRRRPADDDVIEQDIAESGPGSAS